MKKFNNIDIAEDNIIDSLEIMNSQKGFLGLGEGISYKDSQVVITPFGVEESATYADGFKNGSKAIIDASHQVELFDDEYWCEPVDNIKIVTCKPLPIAQNLADISDQAERINEVILQDRKFPFILGGGHVVTIGAIKPFIKRYDDLVVLHFSAYADLKDDYNGKRYSHISALRRVVESDNISKLISIGIRNISKEEAEYIAMNNSRIDIYWTREKRMWIKNIDTMLDPILGKNVYLNFDVSCLDSSIMAATDRSEPGGMFWDEVNMIIKKAAGVSNIVGADFVGLSPIKNFCSYDFLAAKLCYKMLAHIFLNKDGDDRLYKKG